jgi:hypothetical protein
VLDVHGRGVQDTGVHEPVVRDRQRRERHQLHERQVLQRGVLHRVLERDHVQRGVDEQRLRGRRRDLRRLHDDGAKLLGRELRVHGLHVRSDLLSGQ